MHGTINIKFINAIQANTSFGLIISHMLSSANVEIFVLGG